MGKVFWACARWGQGNRRIKTNPLYTWMCIASRLVCNKHITSHLYLGYKYMYVYIYICIIYNIIYIYIYIRLFYLFIYGVLQVIHRLLATIDSHVGN